MVAPFSQFVWHAMPCRYLSDSQCARLQYIGNSSTQDTSSILCERIQCTQGQNVKGHGLFSCSAVSSPLDRSERFTLCLPWQTCSFRHQLGFSGKHSSHAAIKRNDYSLTSPPLSIARFIQLSELGHWEGNENAQSSKG